MKLHVITDLHIHTYVRMNSYIGLVCTHVHTVYVWVYYMYAYVPLYVSTYVHAYLCMTFTDTYILQNCTVTSPSTRTIRVSCDSSHQILVTLTCTNNCNNPMVTSNGSSPLTVRALDPGMMYSVTISVFDDNQEVLSDQKVTKTITVMSEETGNVHVH